MIEVLIALLLLGFTLCILKNSKYFQPTSSSIKVKSSKKIINIYYGTQSGTAETFAHKIGTTASSSNDYIANVIDLDDLDELKFVNEDGVSIFFMATYGEGGPTDNADIFYRWLSNAQKDKDNRFLLKNKQFAVFGLGNKEYQYFNKIGLDVDRYLFNLGGQRLCDVGLGDSQVNIDKDFEIWERTLLKSLNIHTTDVTPKEFEYRAKFHHECDIIENPKFDLKMVSKLNRIFFEAREVDVVVHRELRKRTSDDTSTSHIEVDLGSAGLTYNTGDTMNVLPENSTEIVEKVCRLLDYDLDAQFSLISESNETKRLFPNPCTIQRALSRYIDLHGRVSKDTMRSLLQFITDEDEKLRFTNLINSEDAYAKEVYDPWTTLPNILDKFKSIQIPIDHLLEIANPLKPRSYTISSSALSQPDIASITVKRLIKQTHDHTHLGLASSYIKENRDKKLRITILSSNFKLQQDLTKPIILIGCGTGISPMRGILQELSYHHKNGIAHSIGDCTLFFGCKNRDQDYIYEDELQKYTKNKTLTNLFVAFSRDDTKRKIYVQDLIKDNTKLIWNHIENGAYIYVCGGTQMGKDVMATFIDMFAEKGVLDGSFQNTILDKGRYIQELWSN